MAGAGVAATEMLAKDCERRSDSATAFLAPAENGARPEQLAQLTSTSSASPHPAISFIASLKRRLVRSVHGNVPESIRPRCDTEDLVQDAVVGLLETRTALLPENAGAIYSFLRVSIRNRIVDELRKAVTEIKYLALRANAPSRSATPVEKALVREQRAAFREALLLLEERDRLLVAGRIELGFSYAELAEALDYPSSDAARMAAKRAVLRIGSLMERRKSRDGEGTRA